MAEILSQSQIDDLLSELTSHIPAESSKDLDNNKNIRAYDFKSPKKMSREQSKMLTSINEVFARHVAAYFVGILRTYCEITIGTIDEHPYFEYNNALPDNLMTAVIDVDKINGVFLLDVSNNLTFALVERLLGGNIEDVIVPSRDFSEIEIALIDRILKRICLFWQETLQAITDINVTLRQIETNTRFIKAIRIEEIVEVVVLNVTIGSVKGTITACFPYNFVDTMLELIAKSGESGKPMAKSEDEKHQAMLELRDVEVDLCAILGNVKLTLKDLLELHPGDVIKLEQRVGNPAVVTVNGNSWFKGEPGIRRSSKAIKLIKYEKTD